VGRGADAATYAGLSPLERLAGVEEAVLPAVPGLWVAPRAAFANGQLGVTMAEWYWRDKHTHTHTCAYIQMNRR
jgi:hypothetical protein